ESALVAHTAVREAVTIVREDRPGDKRLVAYLILHEGVAQPDQVALRDFVGGKLPPYMVPAAFVFLESFPKTPNRKIDRKALPAPDMAREDFGRSYVAPRGPVEVIVAQIIAQSLDLDSVGIWDNFFELGGHSLLVTRVIFRITELFRLEVPLRRFFENPTVAGIAAFMTADESERMRIERTAQLLIKLSQLSDEEVAGMLASRGGVKA
ncbi:MAG: non-ribosomal peptide synthetase, partial [Anaerolineae bacterium]|nr:non-ribosomal peptide synthetase [Anaerolineae bacterium]